MDIQAITSQRLASSVVAVPPLARDAHGKLSRFENQRLVQHMERGGISTLLYGGNAVLYHIRMCEYEQLLTMLQEIAGKDTLVIPSVGPAYGTMMDQVGLLKNMDYPTVMVLPQREIADPAGIAVGIRRFAEAFGKPIVLYLKHDRWLPPETVASMYRDGLISWIKYAVVRDNPAEDDYLREILQWVPCNLVVSGIGEQPAIIHMRDFGVISYTSGCVCVAPARSMEMLRAIQNGDYEVAEILRQRFSDLEDLRNQIQPIRVLHRAVDLAGIASTGPMQPMLGELLDADVAKVSRAASELLQWNAQTEPRAANVG